MNFRNLFLAVALLLFASPLWAEETPTKSAEECYATFKARYTPESVVQLARAAANHVAEKGEEALSDYLSINPRSWPDPPYSPPITIMRCDNMSSAAFFLPQVFEALKKPGMLKKFQDAEGQHTFFNLCKKVQGKDQAAWVMQTHFWTGCEGPLRMGVLGIKVPGTPYMIQSSLPSAELSLEDFEKTIVK
ncbi:MAG: hypothetical protein RRB13_07970 [bacterium]|nr:hypothetical protein [bacterium]